MEGQSSITSRFEALRVNFFTVIVKVAAIHGGYPDALDGFDRDFPDARRSERLRGISAMSMQDVDYVLEVLASVGIALGSGVAVADCMHGEIASCVGIEFLDISEGNFPHWLALPSSLLAHEEARG